MAIRSRLPAVIAAISTCALSACVPELDAIEAERGRRDDREHGVADQSSATRGTVSVETAANAVGAAAAQANGCSIVQWCNAPGPDRIICVQSKNCSDAATFAECAIEVHDICGARGCPWWVMMLDGRKLLHNECTSHIADTGSDSSPFQ
jgi:hypothetical protein